MKHRLILSFLRNFCLILGVSTISIYATPLPYEGQNIWHVAAEIGTDVDLLLSKLDECCATLISTVTTNCDPIPLYQTNVINGGILLTTTGASYCLSQNITGSIIISASDVTVDLNTHSLIGTIDIIGTSSNATIQNGNVKPAAPTNLIDAAHAAIVIDSNAYNTLIKNVNIINADSTIGSGRNGINNAGTNTIITNDFIEASNGGTGIENTGANIQVSNNTIILGTNLNALFAFVANIGSDNVTRINIANNTTTTIPAGDRPVDIAITPDGTYALVVNQSSNNVTRINIANNSTLTIPVGSFPTDIAITPDGTYAFVANNNASTVTRITIANGSTISIPVTANPYNIAITPDGTYAFVAHNNFFGGNTVTRINISNNATNAITVGLVPQEIAITPDSVYAFVTNTLSGTVTRITVANNATLTIPVGASPNHIDITPDGTYAFVVNGASNDVTRITIATNATSTIPVGSTPEDIAITPDGVYAFVVNSGGGNVTRITIATSTTTTIGAGSFPIDVAITPDGTYAFIANSSSDNVTRITIATSATITIPVGDGPNSIAITPIINPNGIVQHATNGKFINNIIKGTASGNGIIIDTDTNCNIIQHCSASNNDIGFSMLTTGTVNLIECIAQCCVTAGFDLSQSTGRGIVKRCEALQNIGCGFVDRSNSLYQYISNSSEGNDGSPAVPAGDTNYCWSDFSNTSTFVLPSGPGSRPFYQWARNGDDGTFFGVSSWDNVTLR